MANLHVNCSNLTDGHQSKSRPIHISLEMGANTHSQRWFDVSLYGSSTALKPMSYPHLHALPFNLTPSTTNGLPHKSQGGETLVKMAKGFTPRGLFTCQDRQVGRQHD